MCMASEPPLLSITADPDAHAYASHSKDITLFWTLQLPKELAIFQQLGQTPTPDKNASLYLRSLNDRVTLTMSELGAVTARSCICRCFRGQYLSGTFRCEKKPTESNLVQFGETQWHCSPLDGTDSVVIQTLDLVHTLWTNIGPNSSGGLVVFSGATNSAKSQVAQAFALEAIRSRLMKKLTDRRPHQIGRAHV